MTILKDQIDIWVIEFNQINYYQALAVKYLLSELESRKQNSFTFEKDQTRYLISHIALRFILSKYLNTSPKLIEYQFNSSGKPSIVCCSGVHFNLSHSGKLACIGISSTEIGIDIEYVTKNFNHLEIANDYFSQEELNLINSQRDNANRSKMFFKIWTIKEALLKATGTGLTADLPTINLKDNQWLCSNKIEYSNWQIKELELLQEGYIASLAHQRRASLTINYCNYIL